MQTEWDHSEPLNLWILPQGNYWKHVDNEENSAEDPMMRVEALKAEKSKLKVAIARQLNELAGRIAGVNGVIEPRSLKEIVGIKVTLKRSELFN